MNGLLMVVVVVLVETQEKAVDISALPISLSEILVATKEHEQMILDLEQVEPIVEPAGSAPLVSPKHTVEPASESESESESEDEPVVTEEPVAIEPKQPEAEAESEVVIEGAEIPLVPPPEEKVEEVVAVPSEVVVEDKEAVERAVSPEPIAILVSQPSVDALSEPEPVAENTALLTPPRDQDEIDPSTSSTSSSSTDAPEVAVEVKQAPPPKPLDPSTLAALEQKRWIVTNEFLSTERTYLQALNTLVNVCVLANEKKKKTDSSVWETLDQSWKTNNQTMIPNSLSWILSESPSCCPSQTFVRSSQTLRSFTASTSNFSIRLNSALPTGSKKTSASVTLFLALYVSTLLPHFLSVSFLTTKKKKKGRLPQDVHNVCQQLQCEHPSRCRVQEASSQVLRVP